MTKTSKITCITSGLVALDIICLSKKYSPHVAAYSQAGGSCGNVTAIVAADGHHAVPIARLGIDSASNLVLSEFAQANIDLRFLSKSPTDRVPIIFQYLKNDGKGGHRFDLRHPVTRKYLPPFRPVTRDTVQGIVKDLPSAHVFYADRITPGTILLAELLKERGSLIFFEPQRASEKELRRISPFVDILKFSSGRLDALEVINFGNRTITVIETVGSAGVRFQCAKSKLAKKWASVPAISGVSIVDSAGAGDWMSAYLICNSLLALAGHDAEAILRHLRIASAWSFLAILFPGARGMLRHLSMSMVQTLAQSLSKSESIRDRIAALEHHPAIGASDLRTTLSILKI